MSIELKYFFIAAAVQLLYYFVVFARLNFIRGFSSLPEFLPPASVVICAKNEAQNLLQNLKVVLIQQYPQYEVVVVNDQSNDNTNDVLAEFCSRNENLKVVNISPDAEKNIAGKKYALQKGIDAATFDIIVVTDADCRPATTHWLAKMAGAYMSETQIVLGHSPFEKQNGLLDKIIRYENFLTALQYFGFAKLGLPYMGVGRNLSYKKDLFRSFDGFEKSKNMLTGDDDLFISAKATKQNTEVCMDKDAFTYTKAKTTFSDWLQQKKRHLRAGVKYKIHHQFLLFLFALSGFIFYASFIVVLAKGIFLKWAIIAFFSTILLKMLSVFRFYKKSSCGDLFLFTPLLDALFYIYLLHIFFLLLLQPKDKWT